MPVLADDRRIRQVLANLVGNAIKYSAAGTPIEVRLGITSDRRSAFVQVRDEGPAIPRHERAQIFDKFVRLSTAGSTRGSGLGLHISRAIVLDHGGEIWAEWPASGGNVFSFTLPLSPERRTDPSAPSRPGRVRYDRRRSKESDS
jgi:signal transduction histidine kinase